MNKHRTHLPTRFLMATSEENLIVAIIKQAWCDAFMNITAGEYYGLHQHKEQKNARQMFEGGHKDEWRQSLKDLAQSIQIDDEDIVNAYYRYGTMLKAGKTDVSPDDAFDILIKTLI